MKTLHRFFAALGVMLALCAAAQTRPPTTTPLKGTVVDAADRPVAGAIVESHAYPDGARLGYGGLEVKERATTDASGRFELQLPANGAMIVARKAGLAPAWNQFMRMPGTEPRLVLMPPSVLAGVVVDETGKPVVGVEVSVAVAMSETKQGRERIRYDPFSGKPARDAFNTRTAANGRFRIDGFPTNASANLTVQAPGKALRQARIQYAGPDTMQCRAGQEDIRLVVEPAGSVAGKVAFEGNVQPLPKARLTLQPDGPRYFGEGTRESAESGDDGTFHFPDVSAGSYRIHASFGTNTVPDWVADNVPVSVDAGQTTRDVLISATRGGLLEVAALSKNNRKPTAQVGVSAYKGSFQTGGSSGSNGIARLRLPPGNYQVSASKEGWRSDNTAATVEAGRTNRIEIELAPLPKITGVVRRPDGQPAAGLELRIIGSYGDEGSAPKSDANGRFKVEFDPRQFGRSDMSFCLLIRDPERNLAVAQDIDEDTGPLDLRLAPGVTFAGRAECDGKPVTNATAALVFWTGRSGMHLSGLCRGTNTPGRFEIPALPPGRRYGLYVSAPGYGQASIHNLETETEARRVELEPVELKRANLKLAGQVLDADDKPVAGASIHLNGEGQPNANARTDREGRFSFAQVCEGPVQLFANARNAHGNTSAEGGATNVVLRLGESRNIYPDATAKKLKGVVTDPHGKPAAGVQVAVFPSYDSRWMKTGTNGGFNLSWTIQPWQLQSGGDPCLVVRDTARNLAAVETISEDTTNLNVRLQPALTLTGRVQGANNAPLADAQVGVWFLACRTYCQLDDRLATTDARGGFEIKTLPVSLQYTVFAKAKGHGRCQEQIQEEPGTNRIKLPPFVLKLADQVLAGQVLNRNDKPVSGVHVSLSGDDQPDDSVTTDSKGRFRFKVCEGQVRLFASSQGGFGNTTAEAGDTNVVIHFGVNEPYSRQSPKRPSLQGKPLPDLAAVGLASEARAGKPLLLCLFDAEQRPSRRSARLLAEQHNALRQKGLTVLAVQAAVTAAESFETWKSANPLPFPLGRVTEKSAATKWVTDVESLPWLILRDTESKVVAEGFALDELDAKLKAVNK